MASKSGMVGGSWMSGGSEMASGSWMSGGSWMAGRTWIDGEEEFDSRQDGWTVGTSREAGAVWRAGLSSCSLQKDSQYLRYLNGC